MSSMAKIFVVVNLILVTMVWGSAATLLGAQNDYRGALKEATESATAIQSQMQKDIEAADLRARTQTQLAGKHLAAAEDAEQRRMLAEKRLDEASQVNQQLTAANQGLATEVGALRKINETQQATVSAAQSEAKDANTKFQNAHKQLEEETRNRAELEARVQELDDTTRTLQAQTQDQAKQIRDLQFWIEKAKEKGFNVGDFKPLPEGRVLQVESVAGGGMIVILSVGSDDGVTVGAEYRLSRGKNFVGFATVTRVYNDKAVATFDTQFTGSGAPPQAQDRAYHN